eukprot:101512_1
MASAGSKRKLDSLDNITNPPLKKQKVARAKLGKTDYELIKNGLKSVMITIHNDNNNTHTRSARAKSTVSNLLHLRRRRRSSVSTIHLDSLNISDHSPPIPQRKLSLKECLTTEFIDQCKETAEEEVAYYLSIDFDVYHEDKIEQLLSNPLLAFETAPLVTKCPILSCRIAPYYLVDHDSESSSEAQFSDAGFTASDIRSLLKPETLRSLQLERMQYLRKEKMKPKSI